MKKPKCLIALLLSLTVVLGTVSLLTLFVAGKDGFTYDYVLRPTSDGQSDGQISLDLYVTVRRADGTVDTSAPAGPALDSGAFGLYFPEWVQQCQFDPNYDEIMLQRIVPDARYPYPPNGQEVFGSGYHAFAWTGIIEHNSIDNSWKPLSWTGGNYGMLLGTYKLTLPTVNGTYRLPAKNGVGQLDWLKAAESIPTEVGESSPNGADRFNLTLWNPKTNLYQGYYAEGTPPTPEDALLVQTDIGFQFVPPDSWLEGFMVLSYDPKKPITATLYSDAAQTTTVATLSVDGWTGADTPTVYAAPQFPADSGTGPYFTMINTSAKDMTLTSGEAIQKGKTYYLALEKPGSLKQTLKLIAAADGTLRLAAGFPAEGEWIYLPAGDLNKNGRIDMGDRSILLGVMNKKVTVTGDYIYLSDIDGDGRVTVADMSILTAAINYTKRTKEGE